MLATTNALSIVAHCFGLSIAGYARQPLNFQLSALHPMARNHHHEFAVIGLGRFGASLALTLMQRGFNVLGIDRDPEIVQRLADQITQTVALDATGEDALRAVGIASFDTVVVAIGSNFESNLLATVALKAIGVKQVFCKALTER